MSSFRQKLGQFSGLENEDYSEEQRTYMKQFALGAAPYLIGGLTFNLIFVGLVISGTIDFSLIGKTRAEELKEIQSRIEYVLKFSTPGILWLFFCIMYVIHYRIRCPAMDPLNNSESFLVKPKNILQNSLEQFVLSLTSQLILVTHLSEEQVLKFIPALSFLFILGRICFLWGYPQRRAFGMITTLVPIFTTLIYILIKFFDLYF